MRISSNECDDEEEDLPFNILKSNKYQETNKNINSTSISFKTDKISLNHCGLKRKSPSLSLSNGNINKEDIPTKKKGFFIKLPSVSTTKLNCPESVVVSNQITNNNHENSTSIDKVEEKSNSLKGTRKRKYEELFSRKVLYSDENYQKLIIEESLIRNNKEQQDKYTPEKELENTEHIPTVRKFFKSHNSANVKVETTFDCGYYSFKAKRDQQDTQVQQQQSTSELQLLEKSSINDKLKKKLNIKRNQIEKNSIKNTNLQINKSKDRLGPRNFNLSLSLSSPANKLNNKENQLPVSPSAKSEKSNEITFSATAVEKNSNTEANLIPFRNKSLKTKTNKIDLTLTENFELKTQHQEQEQKQEIQQNISHKNKQDKYQKKGEKEEEKVEEEEDETTISESYRSYNFFDSRPGSNLRIKSNIMSMYDRRIQSDERTVNGYAASNSGSSSTVSRGIHHHHHHHHHNEDSTSAAASTTQSSNSSIMNNHYYQCPPPPPPPPQPSMATLCNIGNTCYLNSVIYTLRFAPMFLHNLHHLVDDLSNIQKNLNRYHMKSSSLGRNITGLHMENTRSWSSKDLASLENMSCDMPKSNQQIATEKLHELYQSLHRNEYTETTEPFHADTFLHAIQDVSAIFEGNQQQDAHEFLMCVLDIIRETCQSLIKAVSECPDAIINGCISLPEQKESQCAATTTTTIPKEKPLQRDTGSSAIIKASFFSRKSKRKEQEMKISKNNATISNNTSNNSNNNRLQSPYKDNTNTHQVASSASSSSSSDVNKIGGSNNSNNDGDTLNGSKHSLKSDSDLTSATNIKDNKERLSDKIKKLGFDFFSEDFEGITVSTTKCLSCETITEQKETMIDIAVPITGYENIDLGEKFIQDSCVTKEYFRGENKYRCEKCMGYTEAIRSISYEILPRLLVIQLSRFSGVMQKINTYLPTPFTLQCFCSKCLGSSSSSTSSENKNLHVYKLFSVITHVGATMSVGHYIAYTCSLDWANDYINCPKDRIRQAQLMKQQQQQTVINTGSGNNNTTSNNNILNGPEKNVRQIKKMLFGRNKASSSSDMSKTMRNINGLSSNKSSTIATTSTTTNNDKQQQQQQNTICPSINCCGLQLRNNYLLNNLNYNNNSNGSGGSNSGIGNSVGGYYIDVDESSSTSLYNSSNYNNSNNSSGYGTNTQQQNSSNSGRNRSPQQQQNEPIWYMCDDDKIKAMSQREFEDMLSPNRKIMITPYLLFYARNDVQ